MLKETKDGILLQIKISPNASKNAIIRDETGLKVKLTAQPIEGKANKALIEFLSKQFKIPKTSIEILKGETSKEKILLLKIFDNDKIQMIKNQISDRATADLRTDEAIASSDSEQIERNARSAKSETLRAWSKSKTSAR